MNMTTDEAITILRTTIEENLFNGEPTSDAQKRLYEAMLMGEEALKDSEWFSVSDKLPDNERSVLVYTKNGGVAEASYNPKTREWLQFRWSVKVKPSKWRELPKIGDNDE